MKKIILVNLIVALGLISCQKEKIQGEIKNDPEFAEELRSSPENLIVGNNNLILTTFLYRDFMPNAEKNGSIMYCSNELTDTDSLPISTHIILKKQYVIKGNVIWTADYNKISSDVDYILKGTVFDGPKWGPEIEVDVVCEFEYSGLTKRILAKSQYIYKTS